jgi:hypothetical protein|tara:strand:- start:269 stop:439 length:171 start_codon:yes stop_codon:yes gene_type:complete
MALSEEQRRKESIREENPMFSNQDAAEYLLANVFNKNWYQDDKLLCGGRNNIKVRS